MNKLLNIKKIPIAMRITCLLLCLIVFQLQAEDVYSQKTKISLDMKNTTIEKVLQTIEEKSDYHFLYNNKLVNVDRKVSVRVKDAAIADVLDKLFASEDVEYQVEGNQIILSPKEKVAELVSGVESAQQQQKTITGKVTDTSGQPLPGATVMVKGTTIGTITDADGNYKLSNIPYDATLVFSFVGMETQEIKVGNQTKIDVALQEEAVTLEEVVAIGYGTQLRRSISSAVSSIDIEDALKIPVSSVSQALSGRAAGLNVNLNSAQPGGGVYYQIRGSATGRSPLIVIDGMPTSDFSPSTVGDFKIGAIEGNLSLLNPKDIESIDILKDASATAIYGSKAAGGVILITTKRGKEKEGVSVNFDASAGSQHYYKIPKVLTASEFMRETNKCLYEMYLYESRKDVYITVPKPSGWTSPVEYLPYYTEEEINKYEKGIKKGTNWVDEITNAGFVQDYNFSVNGKQKNTRFYSSLGVFDQKGIIKNNDLSKYSGTINVDQRVGERVNIGLNARFTQENIDHVSLGNGERWENSGIFMSALTFDPTLPVYDEKGGYQKNIRQANIPNPVSYLEISNKTTMERFFYSLFANYYILPQLSIKGQFGFDRMQSESYYYIPRTHIRGASFNGKAQRAENMNTNYQLQFLINYAKTFNDEHNLSSTLGTEYVKYKYEGMNITATNFPYDGVLWNNLALGSNRPNVGSSGGSSEILSYFLRLNYDYKFKYFINANFRIDGSSNFSPENQYGFFPGISVAWDISKEPFMESSSNWLNQLKFRAGYGVTGNDNIGSAFTDWYGPGYNTMWGNSKIISGVLLEGLGNPSLKWEQQTDFNFGIDFNIKNRFSGEIDIFNRVISRLLGSRNLPSWSPVPAINYNLDAKKQSYGAELTLNTKNIQSKDLIWNSLITVTYYRDRWLKRDPSYVLRINEKPKQYFGELWYHKSDGLVPVGSTDPVNIIPGTIKIIDCDSYLLDEEGRIVVDERGKPLYSGKPDGKIDDADLQLIGVNIPYTIGFGNTLKYKQFDFSIFAYGKFNQWKTNNTKIGMGGPDIHGLLVTVASNLDRHVLKRWNHDNLNGTEASSIQGQSKNGSGDFYLEKAWFIRIRDITLGYTIPTGKWGQMRFYCNILNPFLITPYSGMDPETDSYMASYPNQRTFNFGFNFSF